MLAHYPNSGLQANKINVQKTALEWWKKHFSTFDEAVPPCFQGRHFKEQYNMQVIVLVS